MQTKRLYQVQAWLHGQWSREHNWCKVEAFSEKDAAQKVCAQRQGLPLQRNPSVPEFVAYAKATPGKIDLASAGTGTGSHIAGTSRSSIRIRNLQEYDRKAASCIANRLQGRVGLRKDEIRPRCDRFFGENTHALNVAAREAIIDLDISSHSPSEHL
jgi:hypothetical protein